MLTLARNTHGLASNEVRDPAFRNMTSLEKAELRIRVIKLTSSSWTINLVATVAAGLLEEKVGR